MRLLNSQLFTCMSILTALVLGLPLFAQDFGAVAEDSPGAAFGLGWMLFGGFVFLLTVGLLAWISMNLIMRNGRPHLR